MNGTSPTYDPYHGRLDTGPTGPSFCLKLNGNIKDLFTPSGRVVQLGFNNPSKSSKTEVINSICTAPLRLVGSEVGCEEAKCSVRRMRTLNRNVSHLFGKIDKSF